MLWWRRKCVPQTAGAGLAALLAGLAGLQRLAAPKAHGLASATALGRLSALTALTALDLSQVRVQQYRSQRWFQMAQIELVADDDKLFSLAFVRLLQLCTCVASGKDK